MVMETLPPGTVLYGRYRIERALGSGGFGHVYLSIDLRTNQQYAVKEYLVAGASGKVQLEHEARVLSQVHHPSMPAFQDAFDERGRYYIVLGYIEGSDLTDFIRVIRQRNEVVPLIRILTWIISICDAVTFLHNHNPPVIHRDIKPDNIRITPIGSAILVDLGNAKATADGARTLFFIRHQGTPGYAPLEQYPGGSGTDIRSDVYALGGTLYFALTTHEPPSVSTRNQSIQQKLPDLPSLQEQLAHNPPETNETPASVRQFRLGVTKPAKPTPRHSRHLAQLGTLPPELLERLNQIINKAMQMEPNERYQTVAEMSNDLKFVLASLQSLTQPPASNASSQVDPHSTQPDLPHLYENLQNAQAVTDHTSPNIPHTPSPPQPQPSEAPDLIRRCPQCNAEVRSMATFCPQCGISLAHKPQNSLTTPHPASGTSTFTSQNSMNPLLENNRTFPITSVEPSMIVTPPLPGIAPHSTGTSGLGSSILPIAIPSNANPSSVHTPTKSSTQDRFFPSTPSHLPPKTFITSSAPTHVQDTPITQEPHTASNTKPSNSFVSSEMRKILLYMLIVFVVVLLIVFFIVLKGSGHHSSGSTTNYHLANVTQIYNYERNV